MQVLTAVVWQLLAGYVQTACVAEQKQQIYEEASLESPTASTKSKVWELETNIVNIVGVARVVTLMSQKAV